MSEVRADTRHWVRTFWSTVLIVLACLLAPLSVVSVWARAEVTNTSRYVKTVAPLASNPAVQEAVATRITDEILATVDVPALAQEAVGALSSNRDLTDRQTAALAALTGPLTSGIESYTEEAVTEIVQSEQFATVWVEANTVAHQRLDAALSGQNADRSIRVEDSQVVLDLDPLVGQVKQRLLDRGFMLAEKIPDTTRATIVLFQAPNATLMQTAYSTLNTLGFWLPLVAIALAVAGSLVCHNRRRAVTWLGFGLIVTMGLAAAGLGLGKVAYLNALPADISQPAATAFFEQFTAFLRQALQVGAVVGTVLFVGGLRASGGAGLSDKWLSWGAGFRRREKPAASQA